MRRHQIWLSLLLLLAPLSLEAQDLCPDNLTIQECWNAAPLIAAGKPSIAAKPTGVDTAGESLSSTVKDFAPRMDITGLLNTLTGGGGNTTNNDGTIDFDLNFFLRQLTKDNDAQLKAVVNMKPTLYAPFKALLPEATRDKQANDLEGKLGSFDDSSLVFTYNPMRMSYGRNFKYYRQRFAALVSALPQPDGAATKAIALNAVIQKISPSDVTPDAAKNTSFQDLKFSQIRLSKRAQLRQAVESAALAEASANEEENQAAQKAGLFRFIDLVNNQPQLYVSVKKSFRRDLAGPEDLSGKITWEIGFANINDFEKEYGQSCRILDEKKDPSKPLDSKSLAACLDGFTQYIQENDKRLKQSQRASFALEYAKTDNVRIQAEGLDHTFKGGTKVTASAGYGQILQEDDAAGTSLRFDFVANYDKVSNDATRQSRAVGSLTLTWKNKSFSIPLGVVYANKAEFLTDVNRRLSAHVGIKFKIDSLTPQ